MFKLKECNQPSPPKVYSIRTDKSTNWKPCEIHIANRGLAAICWRYKKVICPRYVDFFCLELFSPLQKFSFIWRRHTSILDTYGHWAMRFLSRATVTPTVTWVYPIIMVISENLIGNTVYKQETLVHAPKLWAEEISKRASLFS